MSNPAVIYLFTMLAFNFWTIAAESNPPLSAINKGNDFNALAYAYIAIASLVDNFLAYYSIYKAICI